MTRPISLGLGKIAGLAIASGLVLTQSYGSFGPEMSIAEAGELPGECVF
ncbi:hypothetical protein NON20_00065 [Synechocystis sp. B12]|nr:hypothetical protein NON20_00065 [Synechocystis sp. B12]